MFLAKKVFHEILRMAWLFAQRIFMVRLILEQISHYSIRMRPLKREQAKHGATERGGLNSFDLPYQQPKPQLQSPSFNLPKIQNAFPSILSSPHDAINKLQNYVHKLFVQQHQDVLRARRIKRAKREEQARRQYQKQRDQLIREKQKLELEHLRQKLRQLKKEQRTEEAKLAHQLSFIENFRLNESKSSVFQQKIIQTQDPAIKKQAKSQRLKNHTQSERKNQLRKINYKRKFRVIGYVVYFSLAFKKYVRVFRQLRKRYFYERILAEKVIQKESKNIVQALNLIEVNKSIFSQKKGKEKKSESFTFSEIDDKGRQYDMQIPLSSIVKYVLQFVNNVKQLLKNGTFDNSLQIMSFHLLRQSFLMDNFFLIDQLYRLRVNLEQKQLIMERDLEICLIINFFFSKITCFKFMLSPNRSQPNAKNKQQSRRQKTLLMAGLYLFYKCNQVTSSIVNDKQVRSEGNLQQLDKVLFPKAMQPLQISEQYNFDLGGGHQKRVSIEQTIKFSYLNNNGIKYKNMDKAEDFVKVIADCSQFEKEVNELIAEIGALMHQRCFQARKRHFQFIHNSAIDYKYYLTRDLQVQDISVKRIPNEVKANQDNIVLFKNARCELKKQNMRPLKVMSLKVPKTTREKLSIRENVYTNEQSLPSCGIKYLKNLKTEQLSQKEQPTSSVDSTSRSCVMSIMSRHKGTKSHQYLMANKENQPKTQKEERSRLNVDYRKKELTKIDEVSENKEENHV